MPTPDLASRAFEIADACMLAQLQAHALRIDEFAVIWAIVDADGNGVHDLEESDEGTGEAVEWLVQRGLAEVVESPDGLVVVLTVE